MLTNNIPAVTETTFVQQHLVSLSVADGSDQSWLRPLLTGDQIIWLTLLSHNPHVKAQWKFLWSNAKHSNFLSTVVSSLFFYLPVYQQWFMSADILPHSVKWGKIALQFQGGETHTTRSENECAICSILLPLSSGRCSLTPLSHILQRPYPSSSVWGQSFPSSVPLGLLCSPFRTATLDANIYMLHSKRSSSEKMGP